MNKTHITIKPKPPSKTVTLSCLDTCCLTLLETDIVYTFVNNLTSTRVVYITMSGGGGAGGIGRIIGGYFISGGGGGAAATINNKPIILRPCEKLHIKLGRGGDSKLNRNGETSYLKLTRDDATSYELYLEGGKNGHPNLADLDINTVIYNEVSSGGLGGKGPLTNCLNGENGKKGVIGIPSQMVSLGGDGGCNSFEQGGNGGGNIIFEGGLGGNPDGDVDIIGQDGSFGSGGGGSCPLSNHDRDKLSGNGGHGYAKLEFCCEII